MLSGTTSVYENNYKPGEKILEAGVVEKMAIREMSKIRKKMQRKKNITTNNNQ